MEKPHKEIHGNMLCPCESGLRYASCCKPRKLKWVRDKKGEIGKVIPISPQAQIALEGMCASYLRIFERKPRKKDPIDLSQYLISAEELERQMVDAMRRASVRPEIIFAYQRTNGLLLTEENQELATTQDLQEWEDAIDEYFYLLENPPDTDELEEALGAFQEEFDACIICLGYVLNNYTIKASKKTRSSSKYFSVDDYVLLCAAKSIKTLRSIKTLIERDIGTDALPLVRHIYENYLHIIFAKNKPEYLEHLIDAKFGLMLGTHQYGTTKKGGIDSRLIIRKSDSAEFKGHFSTTDMVKAGNKTIDLELHYYLYDFLSSHTHPTFTNLLLTFDPEGYIDPLSNEFQAEASFYSIYFTAMILDELRSLTSMPEMAKRDIAAITKRIGKKADHLLTLQMKQADENTAFESAYMLSLKSRLEFFGQ